LFATESGEILNKGISENIAAVFWDHICASQKKQNDTLSAAAIATLSAPVFFCQKFKYPHLQPLK